MVEDDQLGWKPPEENNWMTTGQLLMHITNSCGACFSGFVTGDWKMPDGVDISDIPPEEMLPSAEKMPAVESVAEAKNLLAEDKALALEMIEKSGEDQGIHWGGRSQLPTITYYHGMFALIIRDRGYYQGKYA